MTSRVLVYTTGFTENEMSDRTKLMEDDFEFGLGSVALKVPLKYHHENLQ